MKLSRRARSSVLAAAAAALAVTAAPVTPAHALELGIQDDGSFLYQQIGQRTQALNLAQQLGADHIRTIVFWNRIASVSRARASKKKNDPGRTNRAKKPKKGRTAPAGVAYDFRQLDSLANAADARGIKLQMVLTGKSPAYATANRKVGNFKPDPVLYAAWVKAVVSRYKGRGYRYSLWNEPNYLGWLQPLKQAPQLYRELVSAGYAAAKQADPNAQILVAELASFSNRKRSIAPLDFLDQMRCAGCAKLPADGFAYHPYDLTHPPGASPALKTQVTLGTLPRLFKAIDQGGVFRAKLPVYLTEWGYATSGRRGISLQQQAAYTTQAWELARKQPRVKELMQYGLYTRPGTSFDTGIFSSTTGPLPAFNALLNRTR